MVEDGSLCIRDMHRKGLEADVLPLRLNGEPIPVLREKRSKAVCVVISILNNA